MSAGTRSDEPEWFWGKEAFPALFKKCRHRKGREAPQARLSMSKGLAARGTEAVSREQRLVCVTGSI